MMESGPHGCVPPLLAAAALALSGVQAVQALTAPLQPWASLDGDVHLLRPATAQASTSGEPLGALTTGGWRLVWSGEPPTPGRVVARLMLRTRPDAPQTRSVEVLQVGVGRGARAARSCLTYGMRGANARRGADRVIQGRRYAVWTHSDAGMSQAITATDLRTVAGGACYAVERVGYKNSASEPDPQVTLDGARGAAMLDASLASLQLGRLEPGQVIRPPFLPLPPGAVAR